MVEWLMRREEEGATDGEGRPVSGGGRRRIRGRQGKEGSGQCVAILGKVSCTPGGLEGSHLLHSCREVTFYTEALREWPTQIQNAAAAPPTCPSCLPAQAVRQSGGKAPRTRAKQLGFCRSRLAACPLVADLPTPLSASRDRLHLYGHTAEMS